MNAAGRPAHSTREGCGRALIVEHQSFGVWTATTIDASIGVPIQQTTLDDGPAREATGNELCAVAESLASNLGPVDAVIFLAEDTGPAGNFEPKLIAGYPHPVWVVHPSIAIARSVPPQHSRFMVLDFSGGGSATMLKRGAGVGIEDLVECDGDLRSLLSRGPHRQVMHTDLLADVVGAFEPEASAAVAGSIESAPNPTPLQLESIFSELLHDFEPMLGVLQSFGYRTVVCVSAVFTSDIVAAAFTSAAARIGADRRLSFILITGQERYQGALKCVGAVRRSPGVWFAGTIDRPAFSLVSERRISYDVKHVARHIFDPDDTTLAAMLDDRPTLAVVDRTVDGHYGHALSAYAARHISLVGAVAVDAIVDSRGADLRRRGSIWTRSRRSHHGGRRRDHARRCRHGLFDLPPRRSLRQGADNACGDDRRWGRHQARREFCFAEEHLRVVLSAAGMRQRPHISEDPFSTASRVRRRGNDQDRTRLRPPSF